MVCAGIGGNDNGGIMVHLTLYHWSFHSLFKAITPHAILLTTQQNCTRPHQALKIILLEWNKTISWAFHMKSSTIFLKQIILWKFFKNLKIFDLTWVIKWRFFHSLLKQLHPKHITTVRFINFKFKNKSEQNQPRKPKQRTYKPYRIVPNQSPPPKQ